MGNKRIFLLFSLLFSLGARVYTTGLEKNPKNQTKKKKKKKKKKKPPPPPPPPPPPTKKKKKKKKIFSTPPPPFFSGCQVGCQRAVWLALSPFFFPPPPPTPPPFFFSFFSPERRQFGGCTTSFCFWSRGGTLLLSFPFLPPLFSCHRLLMA